MNEFHSHHESATVLAVGTDPAALVRICGALRAAGFRVVAATHSEQAMRLCRDYVVHVALLSDQMAECAGVALACHLRQQRAKLPVVLMTGEAAISDDLAIADYVVPHHASVEEIVTAVTHAAAKAKARAQGS